MSSIVTDMTAGTWFVAITNKGVMCYQSKLEHPTVVDVYEPILDMIGRNGSKIISVRESNTAEVLDIMTRAERQSMLHCTTVH